MRSLRFLLLAILANLLVLAAYTSSGQSKGLCTSQGGRFPPFSSQGKPPGKVPKGPKDLALCRVFRQKTCCDATQTFPALVSVRKLASTGEGSQDCLHLWELLECSICDPHVGVRPGPPRICASFCDMVFEACSDAYFSQDMKAQVLSPCALGDVVCGRAHEWASNGTQLCRFAGFSVHTPKPNSDDTFCYGGKASLSSVADSWKSSEERSPSKGTSLEVLNDFEQWVKDMPISSMVSWAIGGMVLTAGLIYVSKRKSYSLGKKQAAVIRAARLRHLEGKR